MAAKKERLLDRIERAKAQPNYDERVSARLTKDGFSRLLKAAKANEIPYTKLAAICIEEGVDALLGE